MKTLHGYVKSICANGQQIETDAEESYLRTLFLVGSNRIPSNPPVGTKVNLEYGRGGLWWGTVDEGSLTQAEQLPRFHSITLDSDRIDAIEIHGVREEQDGDRINVMVDDQSPDYYSVYVHEIGGGSYCVADFATTEQADFHAHAMSVSYTVPVREVVPQRIVSKAPEAEDFSECQDCGEVWPDESLINPIPDLAQRVLPGEPMPSGVCPSCGAVCQPKP